MISTKYFQALDGDSRTFLSDFIIKSEQYCRVYLYKYNPSGVDGDIDPATGLYIRVLNTPVSADMVDISEWALVNNTIAFYSNPPEGATLVLEVASNSEDLGDIVSGSAVQAAEAFANASETSSIASAASATSSATSATNAANSATASATSATESATSATASAASATASATSATASDSSATDSATSATASANSASSASSSETNAAGSASSASTSASNAATSETNAANSASSASNSATAAATSATQSANSATASASSATEAEGYRDTVVAKEALVNPHYDAIDSAYTNIAAIIDAPNQATTATTQAGIATTQATNASASATAAAGSASEAAGYASVLGYNFEPTVKPTLSLDFANNEHSFYDGIENSFTQAPLDDLVTVSNGSANAYDARGRLAPVSANKARLTFNSETGESEGLLVEEARTNLIDNPSGVGGSLVTLSSADEAPSSLNSPLGSSKSVLLSTIVGNAICYKQYNLSSVVNTDNSYVFSVYVKKASDRYVSIYAGSADDWSTSGISYFDFDTGSFTVGTSFTGDSSIERLIDGWYRLSFTYEKSSVSTSPYLRVSLVDQPDTIVREDTVAIGSVYLWHAQLEQGSFPTSPIPESATFNSRASTATYYDSTGTLQTAAIDEARYTYNPADLTAPHVLMDEVERSNYTEGSDSCYSEWAVGTDYTRELISDNVPYRGDMSVCYYYPNNGVNSFDNDVNNQIVSALPSGTYTLRQRLKAKGSCTSVRFYHQDISSGLSVGGLFYLNGTSDAKIANPITSTGSEAVFDTEVSGYSIYLGDGWHEVYLTFTTLQIIDIKIRSFPYVGTSSLTGDGSSGLYACMSQLEQGSYPTSYIPTTTTAVTRSADNVTYSQSTRVADSVYRDLSGYEFGDEFSVYLEMTTGKSSVSVREVVRFTGDVSSFGEGMQIRTDLDGDINVRLANNGLQVISAGTIGGVSGFCKLVVSWVSGNLVLVVNGQVIIDSQCNWNSSLIKKVLFPTNDLINAKKRSLKIYPKALSEAECMSLTGGA